MSALDLTSYRAGLRDVINSVWPEVDRDAGGSGIFTAARIAQVALEDLRDDDVHGTAAVIQQGPALYTSEWGITNQSYEIETFFHYAVRRDMVTDYEEYIEARLLQLSQYLLYTGPPQGQCLAVTSIDVSESNEINRLLSEKAKPYAGGSLGARMLVGHTAE